MPATLPPSIGKYRILKELGRGASSTVFLGEDPFNDGHVAIKQIHAHLLKDRSQLEHYRKTLKREAQIAGRMRHPSIVRVLDVDVDAHPPYLVLEYVQGVSLSYYAAADRLLPIGQVLDIAYKCCSALDHANRNGLVHRDIKPANLVLQPDGNVKVMDFGTALSMGIDQTESPGLVGSPMYMAPEQVRNEKVTHRSDMFSLGVVLYELVTGVQPFDAETEFAVLYKISAEEPAAPSTLRTGLPVGLDAAIRKAMAKKAEDRFESWSAFGEALLAIARAMPSGPMRDREAERFVQMRTLPFFASFADAALWQTLRLGTLREFDAGEVLLEEDTPGDSFMVILQGRIAVKRQNVHLITLEAGVTLGEMSYLQPENPVRSATAVAETHVAVVEIRNKALRAAPEDLQILFDKAFIKLLVNRLIATNQKLGVWAGLDVLLGESA